MSRKDSVKTTCTSFNGEFIYPAAEFYPVSGELGCFGWRIHPTVGGGRHHDGVDLAMPEGTEVLASASGEVTYVSTDPQAFQNCGACISYGAYIIIKHDDDYTTKYAHLSEILVSAGDTISQGQIIGKSGNSGGSTGPHLHFEINEKQLQLILHNL